MSIKEKLSSMLEDESNGVDEYGLLADEALTSEEIPDKYRSAFISMLKTMSMDENKHFHFLKLLVDMLNYKE